MASSDKIFPIMALHLAPDPPVTLCFVTQRCPGCRAHGNQFKLAASHIGGGRDEQQLFGACTTAGYVKAN